MEDHKTLKSEAQRGSGFEIRRRGVFLTVQTCPSAQPASCTMVIGTFPGLKWPERGADHPSPSSAEV